MNPDMPRFADPVQLFGWCESIPEVDTTNVHIISLSKNWVGDVFPPVLMKSHMFHGQFGGGWARSRVVSDLSALTMDYFIPCPSRGHDSQFPWQFRRAEDNIHTQMLGQYAALLFADFFQGQGSPRRINNLSLEACDIWWCLICSLLFGKKPGMTLRRAGEIMRNTA